MTRNTSEAANGAGNISVNIEGVAKAAAGTLSRAQASQKSAQELSQIATQLSSLMRQFKIERSDRRFDISLPVRHDRDRRQRPASEPGIMTINVSRHGALLKGIRGKIRLGSQVSLSRSNKLEQFLIVWVGEANTPRAGQIGVSAIDPASSFWNDVVGARPKPNSQARGIIIRRRFQQSQQQLLHRIRLNIELSFTFSWRAIEP